MNSYHRMKRTESINEALEQDEILFLRNSPFGKVISLYENPPFSGVFGHFIYGKAFEDEQSRNTFSWIGEV